MDVLVGIDLGTTSFKAVAFAIDGEEIAVGRMPAPWSRNVDGTTMTAEALAACAEAVLKACLVQVPHYRVLSVGVTGMAEAGFLTDRNGTVLGPAYAWLDERGTSEAAVLKEDFQAEQFNSITGLPVTPRCSAVKLRWMNRLRPEGKAGLHWESLPEWMVKHLGGRRQPELSLAARTGLLDIHAGDWYEDLVGWAGLDTSAMITPAPAGQSWGHIRADHPHAAGAYLTVAGHDHVCAALGAGAIREFDAFDSLGTGEAVIRSAGAMNRDAVGRAVTAGLTVGIHVIPGRLLLMAGLGTGARLSGVLTALGVNSAEERLHLEEQAAKADGPVPSSAQWAVEIVCKGLSATAIPEALDDKAAIWRAALYAAGHRLVYALTLLEQFAGPHERVIGAGGWFQSSAFNHTRRKILGRSITLPRTTEATGRGAAILAGVACGIYESAVKAPAPFSEEL